MLFPVEVRFLGLKHSRYLSTLAQQLCADFNDFVPLPRQCELFFSENENASTGEKVFQVKVLLMLSDGAVFEGSSNSSALPQASQRKHLLRAFAGLNKALNRVKIRKRRRVQAPYAAIASSRANSAIAG